VEGRRSSFSPHRVLARHVGSSPRRVAPVGDVRRGRAHTAPACRYPSTWVELTPRRSGGDPHWVALSSRGASVDRAWVEFFHRTRLLRCTLGRASHRAESVATQIGSSSPRGASVDRARLELFHRARWSRGTLGRAHTVRDCGDGRWVELSTAPACRDGRWVDITPSRWVELTPRRDCGGGRWVELSPWRRERWR
jgi:hypothetical protein